MNVSCRREKESGESCLQLSPPFHRLQHGDLVGVFDIAADRDTHRDAGDFHARTFQLLREIGGGGFALYGGVGGDDDLVHAARVDTSNEVGDAKLLRPNAMQRRDRAVKHVVYAVKVLCLFDGGDVGRLFDHAHQALIAGGAAAIDARVKVRDVVTH